MFFFTTFVYPLKVPNITIISEKNSLGNTWDHSGDIGNLLSLFTIIQQGGGIIRGALHGITFAANFGTGRL